MRHGLLRAALLVAGAVLGAALPAAAQSREPPRIVVSGGVGLSPSQYSDLGLGVGPSWLASVRVPVGWPVHLEAFYQQWRDSKTMTMSNVSLFSTEGPVGRADREEIRRGQTDHAFGLNVLVAARVGPVVLTTGGGLQYVVFRESFRQTLHGCTSSVPSRCDTMESVHTIDESGFHALGGLEWPASRDLRVFAQGQFNLLGGAFPSASFATGVRIPIK